MKKNEQKNSKKRLNSLILLVAFTAIMLIVSTYAWFSTQRNVSISNLEGTVKVAEGLEISLDANEWSQEIDFSKFTNQSELKTKYGETEHNVIPTELKPVSTNGVEGIATTEIPFYRGIATQTNGKWGLAVPGGVVETGVLEAKDLGKVEGVGSTLTASDNAFPGYYAIDLFLRNSGLTDSDEEGVTKETLQLSQGSTVTVIDGGNETTGLQNTPRVAFALYNGSADVTAGQSDVLSATTGSSATIKDVAIWEPNASAHVSNSVTNFNGITWKSGETAHYIADTVNGKYTDGEIIPTYVLTSSSLGKTYTDLYNWDGTTNAGLAKQIALQTTAGATTGVKNLITANTTTISGIEKTTEESIYPINSTGEPGEFQLLKNRTLRVRMYVWLEGQDVDCVNYASHGGGIELNIGLCKSEPVS